MTLRQCAAIRPDGGQCKRPAQAGRKYCHGHRLYDFIWPGKPPQHTKEGIIIIREQLVSKRDDLLQQLANIADEIKRIDEKLGDYNDTRDR